MKKKLFITGLVILGGVLIWRKISGNKKPNTEKENKGENREEQHEQSPQHIQKDLYSNAEELQKDLIAGIIQNEDFTSQENFLEKLLLGCGHFCPNFSWYESFPKNIMELEDRIKEYGLYDQYERVLCKIYTGKYPEE